MANGEMYRSNDMSIAAGPKHLFGQTLLVTNLQNERSLIVRVVDRLPRKPGQSLKRIDISKAGARWLDFVQQGRVRVRVQKISS